MNLKKRLNYEKYPACGVPCPPGDIDCRNCKNRKYSIFEAKKVEETDLYEVQSNSEKEMNPK
jgi:hypothetical protein